MRVDRLERDSGGSINKPGCGDCCFKKAKFCSQRENSDKKQSPFLLLFYGRASMICPEPYTKAMPYIKGVEVGDDGRHTS